LLRIESVTNLVQRKKKGYRRNALVTVDLGFGQVPRGGGMGKGEIANAVGGGGYGKGALWEIQKALRRYLKWTWMGASAAVK